MTKGLNETMDLREKTLNNKRHPWELSRAKNLLHVLRKYLPEKNNIRIADVGAGDRFFSMQLLENLKNANITPHVYAIDKEYDRKISRKNKIILINDIQILKNNSMDCIIMMDVLEHIEDDLKFMEIVSEKLNTDGILIITVPAFQNLFSFHDTYLFHYRRYQYQGLKKLLMHNNFEIIFSHYFYTTLFFVRWLQLNFYKLKKHKKDEGIGTWRYGKEHCITIVIEVILNIDFRLNEFFNRVGIRLPGLSLLSIAKKRR